MNVFGGAGQNGSAILWHADVQKLHTLSAGDDPALRTTDGLQPCRRLVLILEPVRVTMQQTPLRALKPKDVRDPVRPLRWRIHAIHADFKGFEVGRVCEFRGHHRGHIFVGDRATLELLTRPIPSLRYSLPAIFVAAPAIKTRCVFDV